MNCYSLSIYYYKHDVHQDYLQDVLVQVWEMAVPYIGVLLWHNAQDAFVPCTA